MPDLRDYYGGQPFGSQKALPVILSNADGTPATGGSGGGGASGPVTVADGADATQGARADGATTDPAASSSVVSILKGLLTQAAALLSRIPTLGSKTSASAFPVVVASDQTLPVSAAALPLPSGASTSALQTTGNNALGAPGDALATDATSAWSIVALLKGLVGTNTRAKGLVEAGGAITAGGTAQQLLAANATRSYLFVENVGTTGDLWVRFGSAAAAAAPSARIAPGGALVMDGSRVTNQSVSIYGATTGQQFAAWEA